MGAAQISITEFQQLAALLYQESGIALPLEKQEMMGGRLRKRLEATGLASLSEYLRLVKSDRLELTEFINVMTTNKTDFFREKSHFEYLAKEVLPAHPGERICMGWSAASSTGQELYTIGMVCSEYRKLQSRFDFRLLGTDIDTQVLEAAERGIYEAHSIAPVEPVYVHSYFDRSRNKDLYKIKDSLKEKCKFRQNNLMLPRSDWGAVKFDFVFLRNVLIYFDEESTRRVLSNITAHMHSGAILFIGHSETLRNASKELTFVGDSIYRKI